MNNIYYNFTFVINQKPKFLKSLLCTVNLLAKPGSKKFEAKALEIFSFRPKTCIAETKMNPSDTPTHAFHDDDDDDLLDWANDQLGKDSERPDLSGSDGSEESEEEDEVQITHDPKEKILPKQRNPNPKPPTKRQPSVVLRRQLLPEVVCIPKIKPKNEEWRVYLEKGATELPAKFYDQRSISTAMTGINALYSIAYYLSILNTDPSYIRLDMACEVHHFKGYYRGPYTCHDYDDFRMVLGVVVAYITAYLMHFNIEISSAIRVTDRGLEFDWNSWFLTWARRPGGTTEEWIYQQAENFREFNPSFMKFVTPFNFMYVCWKEFAAIVQEVLDAWRSED
jgi:hypothetical protein